MSFIYHHNINQSQKSIQIVNSNNTSNNINTLNPKMYDKYIYPITMTVFYRLYAHPFLPYLGKMENVFNFLLNVHGLQTHIPRVKTIILILFTQSYIALLKNKALKSFLTTFNLVQQFMRYDLQQNKNNFFSFSTKFSHTSRTMNQSIFVTYVLYMLKYRVLVCLTRSLNRPNQSTLQNIQPIKLINRKRQGQRSRNPH
eukprot:TRINITY_DN3233_c0_g2_i1.p1 TRINITY_DN3233_c0_g2~~TRINITY_DN3233_c0_g2_i1.p1  ORF type:complete len:199 (+),score=-22.38 TRINITY_DN3233_c0_g2_i1:153-749(+)